MAMTAGSPDNKSIQEINETLKNLSEKIQESNESSAKLNTAILGLTGVGVTIAVIEFVTKLLPKILDIIGIISFHKIIHSIMEWLKNFNDNYANAIQALTPFIIGITTIIGYKVFKFSITKPADYQKSDAESMVSPIFWTLGEKYKILAVHKFEKSDDISGYKHLGQNSRPDQWEKLINIKNSFFNLKHEIIPIEKNDILTVIISRDGKEKWQSINFNK